MFYTWYFSLAQDVTKDLVPPTGTGNGRPHSPQLVLLRRTGTQLSHVMQAHQQARLTGAGHGGHEARRFAFYTLTLVIWQQLKIHSLRVNYSLERGTLQGPPARDKRARVDESLTRAGSVAPELCGVRAPVTANVGSQLLHGSREEPVWDKVGLVWPLLCENEE